MCSYTRLSVSGEADKTRPRSSFRDRHSTSITATGSPDRRPKKSASMPDEKKHIGSWALPGSDSAQSLESNTRAALPSGATLTEPHPVAWKNADRTSFSRPASRSSGRATPVSEGSQTQNAWKTPAPAANPTSWRTGTVKSGASRDRLSWSCRRPARPIVRASVAALEGGALIWDANLGFGPCAAQEFRLVDDRDAERLGLLELRPRVRTDDEGGGLLRHAVGHVPARRLDQLGRLRSGERREGARYHVGLSRERALPLGRGRLGEVELELVQALEQLAVPGLVEEPGHGLGDRRSDAADLADLLGRRVAERLHRAEVAGGPLRPPPAPAARPPGGEPGRERGARSRAGGGRAPAGPS